MGNWVRSNDDIIKGSALMLFFNTATGATASYSPIGFATEHSIEVNLETVDISTKDHGDFAATMPQRLTWGGSASNLYSDEGEAFYMQLIQSMTPVKVRFSRATNYNGYGSEAEQGIVGDGEGDAKQGGDTNWTSSSTFNGDHEAGSTGVYGGLVAEGEALITNYSINASAGDNATMTIQLQGVGALQYKSATE